MGRIYIIPERQRIEESVALIKEYDGAFEYNDFWAPDVLDNRKLQENIIEHYAKYRTDFSNDTMHGAFLDITIHSEDPLIQSASIKRVYQSMDIAKRMGLRGVVFHTGILAGFRIPSYLDNWKQKNVPFFLELSQKYPKQDIYIENMFDEVPEELALLGESMSEVQNFGICMDYAHGRLTSCPEETWVQSLAPYIRHIHINDNDLKNDLHQPVGEGNIDWQKFNNLMKKYQVDASVLIEVKGIEGQRKALEYLKKYGIYPLNQYGER